MSCEHSAPVGRDSRVARDVPEAPDERPKISGSPAELLGARLGTLGHAFRVEARGGLAILTSDESQTLASIDPPLRRRLVQEALAAGFTHVAVEVTDDARAADSLEREEVRQRPLV